jgi:pimeloyl-ACP methyl ester carboxylesterase
VEQQAPGAPPGTAWRADLVLEDVVFGNGKVRLAGTLILPEGKGPHPAVVLTHGSGPSTRATDAGLPMALFFAQQGLAALIYDKRGHGESTGPDGVSAPFRDLAQDAVAGVEALRARPDIDGDRVGLFGHSQGAWIAPLAASGSRHVAFVIMECGGGVTPMDQTDWYGRNLLRLKTELTPAEIEEALTFRRLKYTLAVTGKGKKEMEAALPAARRARWFPHVTERLPSQPFWRNNGGYDPAPALAALRCPVLVILGERDNYTPAAATRTTLERAFRAGGAPHAIKIYPGANHALQ